MVRNSRRYQRTKLSVEVSYRQEKSGNFGGCVAKDISENGIRINTSEFLTPGTMIELQFKLPSVPTSFLVKGRVIWTNKLPYNEQWDAGIELSMNQQYASLIREYALSQAPSVSTEGDLS